MKNYKLKGIPDTKKGIRRIVGTMGVVKINDDMTDEMAEYCIANKYGEYFEKVEPIEETEPTEPIKEEKAEEKKPEKAAKKSTAKK